MSIEKSIGWVKHTINPIGGLCPEEYRCSYCYVPSFYKRFGWKTEPHLKLEAFEQARWRRKPTRYFLCSTHDLFGTWVPPHWIRAILSYVEALKRHTFLVLTKYPERVTNKELPQNLWLGTTITEQREAVRILCLHLTPVDLHFISFEPLLNKIELPLYVWGYIDWIIIGALTLPGGHTKQPEGEWVESLVKQADLYKIPVFLKDNLELPAGTWDKIGGVRREFPKQKARK